MLKLVKGGIKVNDSFLNDSIYFILYITQFQALITPNSVNCLKIMTDGTIIIFLI